MNNKFMIGDLVVCKVGGPIMIVSTVPAAPIQNAGVFGAGGFAIAGGFQLQAQPAAPANVWYNCTWWNNETHNWQQWNFHEDMLDDAPSN